MAYDAEQDRLRAMLPEGFTSLRPVLRINAEIRDGKTGYVEFKTAAEKDGRRGWLNIGFWEDVPFSRSGKTVMFRTDILEISFTGVGVEGACPAERDNAGCFFLSPHETLRAPETITSNKEFCDRSFRWRFSGSDAHGESIGKTLPAIPEEEKTAYPKQTLTPDHAAAIVCRQVLGSYVVVFDREG